jgi:anaerobic nitric oxide reductase flavorubredoxin
MAVTKSVKNKIAAMFGSYGWSGGALRDLKKTVEPAKWSIIDAFEFAGGATKEDLKKAEEFGAGFAREVKRRNEV